MINQIDIAALVARLLADDRREAMTTQPWLVEQAMTDAAHALEQQAREIERLTQLLGKSGLNFEAITDLLKESDERAESAERELAEARRMLEPETRNAIARKFAREMMKGLGLEDIPGVTIDTLEDYIVEAMEALSGETRQTRPTLAAILKKLSPMERENEPWRTLLQWRHAARQRGEEG